MIRVGQCTLGSHTHTSASQPWYTTLHSPSTYSAHLLTMTAKNTSGKLFRLCRNIRERHPGYTLCYLFNHSTGAFTGSMFTLSTFPKSTVSLKDRKLAQRLNDITEFSEGICKQIMELKLDLQSSKIATRPFSFQQTHLPAFTWAACSGSLMAQKRNNDARAESPDCCGLTKKMHPQG